VGWASHHLISILNVIRIYFILFLVAPIADHLICLSNIIFFGSFDSILNILVLSHLLFSFLTLEFFLSLDFLADLIGSQSLELWAFQLLLLLGTLLWELEGVLCERTLEVWVIELAH
jgi:hypothetical protein